MNTTLKVSSFVLFLMSLLAVSAVHDYTVARNHNTEVTNYKDRIRVLEDSKITLDMTEQFGVDPYIVSYTRLLSKFAFEEAKQSTPNLRNSDDLAQILLSIIVVESSGNEKAVNSAGQAYGLTQLQLPTARQYDSSVTLSDLLNPYTNMRIAMLHLIHLLKVFDGNISLAVLAWNIGPTGAEKARAAGKHASQIGYVKLVVAAAAR